MLNPFISTYIFFLNKHVNAESVFRAAPVFIEYDLTYVLHIKSLTRVEHEHVQGSLKLLIVEKKVRHSSHAANNEVIADGAGFCLRLGSARSKPEHVSVRSDCMRRFVC